MKRTHHLVLGFLILSTSLIAQSDYLTQLDTALGKYDYSKMVIQPKLLDENLSKSFNEVVFASSDLVNGTSAFGYSQNKDKTNVSASTNFRLPKLKNTFLEFGLKATGGSGIFNLYSKNSWSNNISGSVGFIRKVGKAGSYYNIKEEDYNKLHQRREVIASIPAHWNNRTSTVFINGLESLKKDIIEVEDNEILLKKHNLIFRYLPNLKSLIQEGDRAKVFNQVLAEIKIINAYNTAIKKDSLLLEYIEKTVLYEFDKANDVTYGYNLQWFNVNVNFGNSTYKFNEKNVAESAFTSFMNIYDVKESINKLQTTISGNYNYTHHGEKRLFYGQLGMSIVSGSFLDNPLINGAPKVIQNSNQSFLLEDEDEVQFGRFDEIKEVFTFGAFNMYGAIFFTKKKDFGFSASFQHYYRIGKNNKTFFDNNFSIMAGPLFRKISDDGTSSTFGLEFGWDNARYGQKITDDFTARIRVGIPFNIQPSETKKEQKK